MDRLGDRRWTGAMIDALEHLRTPVLVAAGLASGLQAGTYYAWASGVMPGLARTDDRTFVHALHQANAAIVNPVFLATFLGAPALTAVAVATAGGPARPWAVAALVLAVSTVATTAAFNVPLNDALAAVDLDAGARALAAARDAFEGPWVRWNVVRALTSTGALGCLLVASTR
jgi:uncharacterized membrane protein